MKKRNNSKKYSWFNYHYLMIALVVMVLLGMIVALVVNSTSRESMAGQAVKVANAPTASVTPTGEMAASAKVSFRADVYQGNPQISNFYVPNNVLEISLSSELQKIEKLSFIDPDIGKEINLNQCVGQKNCGIKYYLGYSRSNNYPQLYANVISKNKGLNAPNDSAAEEAKKSVYYASCLTVFSTMNSIYAENYMRDVCAVFSPASLVCGEKAYCSGKEIKVFLKMEGMALMEIKLNLLNDFYYSTLNIKSDKIVLEPKPFKANTYCSCGYGVYNMTGDPSVPAPSDVPPANYGCPKTTCPEQKCDSLVKGNYKLVYDERTKSFVLNLNESATVRS